MPLKRSTIPQDPCLLVPLPTPRPRVVCRPLLSGIHVIILAWFLGLCLLCTDLSDLLYCLILVSSPDKVSDLGENPAKTHIFLVLE